MKFLDLSGNTHFCNIMKESAILLLCIYHYSRALLLLKIDLFCLEDTTTFENEPTEQLTYTNATNEKESIVMNLLKDIESKKDVRMKWSNNILTRNNLLEPTVGASENIRAKKNAVVEKLEGK